MPIDTASHPEERLKAFLLSQKHTSVWRFIYNNIRDILERPDLYKKSSKSSYALNDFFVCLEEMSPLPSSRRTWAFRQTVQQLVRSTLWKLYSLDRDSPHRGYHYYANVSGEIFDERIKHDLRSWAFERFFFWYVEWLIDEYSEIDRLQGISWDYVPRWSIFRLFQNTKIEKNNSSASIPSPLDDKYTFFKKVLACLSKLWKDPLYWSLVQSIFVDLASVFTQDPHTIIRQDWSTWALHMDFPDSTPRASYPPMRWGK